MNTTGLHDLHLTRDEVVARVFPVHEGAVPVPLHLSVCPECQAKVARLRVASLLDRGAVEGVVEEIPDAFWDRQRAVVLARVRDEAAAPPSSIASLPFRFKATVMRRPAVASASLAAALVLVAGITFLRPRPAPVAAPESAPVATEAETFPGGLATAADARDDELLCGVDTALSEEVPFRSLIPEEA
jgi:hypothetical protein